MAKRCQNYQLQQKMLHNLFRIKFSIKKSQWRVCLSLPGVELWAPEIATFEI